MTKRIRVGPYEDQHWSQHAIRTPASLESRAECGRRHSQAPHWYTDMINDTLVWILLIVSAIPKRGEFEHNKQFKNGITLWSSFVLFLNELTSVWSALPAATRSGERLSNQRSGVHAFNPVFSGKIQRGIYSLSFFHLWRRRWQLPIPAGKLNTVWTFHIDYGAGIQDMSAAYLDFLCWFALLLLLHTWKSVLCVC